ncbi:MAG: NUDIX domain-containing protein [Flavobacteriaceae bacterium]|nr:NUDIX domain-containing protein [Flavobacteriaceae bacterium]
MLFEIIMVDELINILAENLTVVKIGLKSEAHKNGWLHASVHIWFYTDDGDVLIQKRAKDKETFPNLWDVSVAGHISVGENEMTSALREIKEELGLKNKANDLVKIGTFKETHYHKNGFIDNELHHIYLSRLKTNIHLLKIQKEELSAIKLISVKEFKKLQKKETFNKLFVPRATEYYDFVMKEIKKNTKSTRLEVKSNDLKMN